MTALRAPDGNATSIPLGWLGEPRLLAGIGATDLTRYDRHVLLHGEPPAPGKADMLRQLDQASIAGRGGAGFPLATKIRALRPARRVEVVVNGCEGEPVSAKDSALLLNAPHVALDGAMAAALAVGAQRVLVAVTDPGVAARLQAAIATRPDASRIEVRLVPERFVAGEARALVSALDGRSGVPPGRRIQPTESGVGGVPTLLSNVETFAQLAILIRRGPRAFAAIGTATEPGTTLLTVTGDVRRPGVLEVPLGLRLGDVAAAAGAAAAQAVVIGGFHGAWLAPDVRLELSRAGLASAGGSLGAGVVMFVGTDTCALAELARVADWLAAESIKQCGPCAFGLPALASDVRALVAGHADPATGPTGPTGQAERHARLVTGRGACAHPDGAARFVLSGLRALSDEVALHRSYGGCGRADRQHLPTKRGAAMRHITSGLGVPG